MMWTPDGVDARVVAVVAAIQTRVMDLNVVRVDHSLASRVFLIANCWKMMEDVLVKTDVESLSINHRTNILSGLKWVYDTVIRPINVTGTTGPLEHFADELGWEMIERMYRRRFGVAD